MATQIETVKCLNVVYMDEKIGGDKILRFLLDSNDYTSNGSYIRYEVGEASTYEDYNSEPEDAWENNWKFRELDEILMKNYGLVDGEQVLLLIWW